MLKTYSRTVRMRGCAEDAGRLIYCAVHGTFNMAILQFEFLSSFSLSTDFLWNLSLRHLYLAFTQRSHSQWDLPCTYWKKPSNSAQSLDSSPSSAPYLFCLPARLEAQLYSFILCMSSTEVLPVTQSACFQLRLLSNYLILLTYLKFQLASSLTT